MKRGLRSHAKIRQFKSRYQVNGRAVFNGMVIGKFDPTNPKKIPEPKRLGSTRFYSYPAADGTVRMVRRGKLFKVPPFVPKPAAKKTRKAALKSASV